MPELPEVEAARLAIVEHCVGKKIMKSLVANDSKVIDGVSPRDLEAELVGKAHRKDKNMWLQLDSPPFPSFQFGRTGALYIKGFAVTKYKRYFSSWRAEVHLGTRGCLWSDCVKMILISNFCIVFLTSINIYRSFQ